MKLEVDRWCNKIIYNCWQMDLEIQDVRTFENQKFSIDFTNMRRMWQSLTIFINLLGMVHTKKNTLFTALVK